MADKELRTGDVAKILGVAPATVWRWSNSGAIPATLVGRTRRYSEAAVLAMRRTITPELRTTSSGPRPSPRPPTSSTAEPVSVTPATA